MLAIEALCDALEDGEPVVRKQVARALGRIGHVQAVGALCQALHDRELQVRAEAARALSELRDQELLARSALRWNASMRLIGGHGTITPAFCNT